ncbi:MAG TPA: tripartite tricarboxylate transporter TctB family protein [Candidatus Methylomirabilis sp.]|nr:tripartite tricarboxylate transporter TctB family protein [Candidatus Methylomirabilis sp.]
MRRGELAISAGMALLAIAFFRLATFTQEINPIDPGPAFYPRLVSLLLLAFSIAQIVISCWGGEGSGGRAGAGQPAAAYVYSLGTLLLSILYIGVFDKASYLVTAPGLLVALMLLGGVRKWTILAGVALGYTLATYYLFGQLLMVPIP